MISEGHVSTSQRSHWDNRAIGVYLSLIIEDLWFSKSRERILVVDLGRTRVGVLGGIGISLIGDFRSIEPLHNEIAIRDFPIEFGPSIMRDVCQEIRRGN